MTLCTSLLLDVFVPDLGPASTSLITITSAMAALIATWVTTDWIAFASTNSDEFCILSCIFASIGVT